MDLNQKLKKEHQIISKISRPFSLPIQSTTLDYEGYNNTYKIITNALRSAKTLLYVK